jgi:hypothetical protein
MCDDGNPGTLIESEAVSDEPSTDNSDERPGDAIDHVSDSEQHASDERPQTMADVLAEVDSYLGGACPSTLAEAVTERIRDGSLDDDPDTTEAVDASYERRYDVPGFMQRLRDGWTPARWSEWAEWNRLNVLEPMSEQHAALYRRGEGT